MSVDLLERSLRGVLARAVHDGLNEETIVDVLMRHAGFVIAYKTRGDNSEAEDLIEIAAYHLDRAVVYAQKEIRDAQDRSHRRS